jgi:anti-anti-sigma factor
MAETEPWPANEPLPGQLIVDTRDEGDTSVLALSGELDLASTPILERELKALESAGATEILIDLAGVGFMDSTGLQALLRARERAMTVEGIQLSLRRGPHQVQRVFELTKTIDAFTFVD